MGVFSDITGGVFGGETSAERGARKAADELRIGGEQAIETTRAAAAPFAALGTGAGGELSAFLGLPSPTTTQPTASQRQGELDALIGNRQRLENSLASQPRAGRGGGNRGGIISQILQADADIESLQQSIAAEPTAAPEQTAVVPFEPFTLQGSTQNVLDDPFFGALAGQQERRLLGSAAARGRVGAGGTQDRLEQNLLLLGNQFRNQDFQSRLQANQQRFGQLFGTTQLGANAAIGAGSQIAGFQTDIASGNAANRIAQGNSTMAGINQFRDLAIAGATGGLSLPFSLGGGGGGGVGSFGGQQSNFGAGGSGLSSQFGNFDIGF